MSGICSAHQHHEPGCPRCEAMARPVTAIERLRAACYLEGTPPPVDQVEADLADVEALYQAAKTIVDRVDYEGGFAVVSSEDDSDNLHDLAAAVRLVEAAQ